MSRKFQLAGLHELVALTLFVGTLLLIVKLIEVTQ